MRLDAEHFSKVENSLSQGSHMCTGTWGGYLNPKATLLLVCLGRLISSLLLSSVATEEHLGTEGEESFYTNYCSPLLSTELKENYIPHAVAVYH